MNFFERVVRAMTHAVIGVALGMVLWIGWSGVQVVSGEWPGRRATSPPSGRDTKLPNAGQAGVWAKAPEVSPPDTA